MSEWVREWVSGWFFHTDFILYSFSHPQEEIKCECRLLQDNFLHAGRRLPPSGPSHELHHDVSLCAKYLSYHFNGDNLFRISQLEVRSCLQQLCAFCHRIVFDVQIPPFPKKLHYKWIRQRHHFLAVLVHIVHFRLRVCEKCAESIAITITIDSKYYYYYYYYSSKW